MSPRYDYGCPNGHKWELKRAVDERDDETLCETCGEVGKRGFSVPTIPWWPDCTRSPGYYREKRNQHDN